jgi:amidophosphoribosyltransferase
MNYCHECHENCGVMGVLNGGSNVSPMIYYGLLALQHRGQESCGIGTHDGQKIHLKKAVGLVNEAFSMESLVQLPGRLGIGHNRYSTAGESILDDASPFMVSSPNRGLVLAHNGNIVNAFEIKKNLVESGTSLFSCCDSEVMLQLLADELRRTKDVFKSVENLMTRLEGGYSVTAFTGEGELIAFRDPLGFRPLSYSRNDNLFLVASESVAFDINDLNITGDISPGEIVVANDKGVEKRKLVKDNKSKHCMFEYVYFSRPDSILDGKFVYDVRIRLGQNLAKKTDRSADVIVPVPDTARPAAEGFSRATGLPVAEGLIKNRYALRTFIMPGQSQRANAVRIKMNALKPVIKDKRVILIDDSIVRGTTSRSIVNLVRKAGAKEVHLQITCPPLIGPCPYGIDISTYNELTAFNHSVEEIARMIGADSLNYQDIDGLVNAIGLPRDELCLACLTNQYPTRKAQIICDKMRTSTAHDKRRQWEIE